MEFVEADFERPTTDMCEAERCEAVLIARRLALSGVERNKAIRIAVVAVRHSFLERYIPMSISKHGSGTRK